METHEVKGQTNQNAVSCTSAEWTIFIKCWYEMCVLKVTLNCYCVIQHFNFQLTHTTLKNVELLKYFKISKTAPTCFGS